MHQTPPLFEVDRGVIRRRRMAAGLDQEEMATRAGISRRYLSHLEVGTRRHMRPGPYQRLRDALNALNDTEHDLLAPSEESPRKE